MLDRAGRRLVSRGRGRPPLHDLERGRGGGARARAPVALCYHNITPGELLRDFNPSLAALCDRGRERARRVSGARRRPDRRLELQRGGPARGGARRGDGRPAHRSTIPPDVPRRDPSRASRSCSRVGRIVPNKRLEDVIKAFALYQRRHAPEASLVLVGPYAGLRELPPRARPARRAHRRSARRSSRARSRSRPATRGTAAPTSTCRCRCTRGSACR